MKSFTRKIFKRNSYPEKFIDRCIKHFLNKPHVPKLVELSAARNELMVAIPWTIIV